MAESQRGPREAGAHGAGLLLVDFVNDMAFEAAGRAHAPAIAAAKAAAGLRDAADALAVPAVYVNDNYGQWHAERSRIVDYCRTRTPAGRELVELIGPRKDDFFVIKPQFSGFYATNLPVLLPKLGVSRLVIGGIAADICVLFTAADAHMRDYDLWVPADLVAGPDPAHTEWALQIMAKSMGAETAPSTELPLAEWLARGQRQA